VVFAFASFEIVIDAVIESDAQACRITAHLLDDQRNIDRLLEKHETSGV
jgi:hypothetical protein